MLYRLMLLSILALTTYGPAWAQDDRPQVTSCYERTYDAAHMKQHPRQQVRWLQIVQYKFDEGRMVGAEIRAKFRGDKRDYADSGICEMQKNGVWRCGVDCDGGQYTLDTRKPGQANVRPLDWGVRVSVCGDTDSGEDAYRVIDPKLDQSLFVLQPVANPAKACKLEY